MKLLDIKEIIKNLKKIKIKIVSYIFIRRMLKNKLIPNLNKKQKKEIKKYWGKRYFGINYLWYKYFTFVNKKFDCKYITEDFFFNSIIPVFNDISLTKAYVDKNYYDNHFKNIKKPKTILRNIAGVFYDENYKRKNKEVILEELLKIEGEYIIKPSLDTGGGRNIKKLIIKNKKIYYREKEINLGILLKEYKKDYLIQECIKQSLFLERLYPKSVNTMRIISYKEGEEFYILAGSLRLGRNESEIDNMSAGGIVIGIDVENGKLKPYGITEELEVIENFHPDTKSIFSNIFIPNWDLIKKEIEIWCEDIPPYFKLVSWDVTLNKENKPVFIELNLRYQGIELTQLNGPIFGEKTEYFLKKVEKYKKDLVF